MKKLLIVALACCGFSATAQVQESKNFLYLYPDSIVYAQRVRLHYDPFNTLVLRVDSRRVPLDRVKFFNNENGFFANTRKLDVFRRSTFAERVMDGKINLYQEIIYDPYYDDSGYINGYGYGRYGHRNYGYGVARPQVNSRMYFNKGYGELQRVNYKNLMAGMADNPECLDMLAGYRRKMNTGNILYGAAGASFIAGIISWVAGATSKQHSLGKPGSSSTAMDKDTGFASGFIFMGLGAGFAIGGFTIQLSASRQLEHTIDRYNGY